MLTLRQAGNAVVSVRPFVCLITRKVSNYFNHSSIRPKFYTVMNYSCE